MLTILEPDFKFKNETGLLIQLVHEGWDQVNVLISEKNSTRGGHYHKESKEVFYIISGKTKLLLSDENTNESKEYILSEGEMFMISPYQRHTFTFEEDTVMVSLYDICVEKKDGQKDIYK